jgi:hypothetical protein
MKREDLIHLIENYLKYPKRSRRNLYFITKELWFKYINDYFIELNLPNDWPLQRKLYHFFKNSNEIPLCSISNKPRKWRAGDKIEKIDLPGFDQGYAKYYSIIEANIAKADDQRKNLLEKFGVVNVFQLSETKEKSKKTLLSKYGVEYISQNSEIKDKKEKTMLERYGRKNNFENFELLFQKYGVNNPMHLPHVHEKTQYNRFKLRHKYILPSGKIIYLQGYEPLGLDSLLQEYQENEIIYKKSQMPKFLYQYQNKTKRYYPDFFIPKANLIVEIKSQYTYQKDLDRNLLKEKCVNNLGFDYKLIIY